MKAYPGLRREMAHTIRAFVDGSGSPRDWDDFTSIRIRGDAMLDAVRLYCGNVYDLFPATGPGAYCSEEGTAELLRVAVLLESDEVIAIDAHGVPRMDAPKI